MVVTDIETEFCSRETSGRFEVTLSRRHAAPKQHPAVQFEIELQIARRRVAALTAAQHINNSIR